MDIIMLHNSINITPSGSGTIGGTLIIIVNNINTAGIWQTVVYAAVGAAVSYLVTVLLSFIIRKAKRK
jgi:hypothetical protein